MSIESHARRARVRRVGFMLLGLGPAPTVQVPNLCFSVGKASQVGTWAIYGAVPAQLRLASAARCG